MPDHTAIQLATAVARRDEPELLLLLDPGVAFRGMTPGRFTEVQGPAAVVEVLLTHWLTPTDQVTGIKSVDTDTVADLHRVGYRLYVVNPSGSFVVEHLAYFRLRADRVAWLQMMSSGLLPRQT
jgi:hypothetical protein